MRGAEPHPFAMEAAISPMSARAPCPTAGMETAAGRARRLIAALDRARVRISGLGMGRRDGDGELRRLVHGLEEIRGGKSSGVG